MHFGDDDGTKTILEDKILELNSNFSKTTNDSESSSTSNENGKVDNDDEQLTKKNCIDMITVLFYIKISERTVPL